MFVWEKLNHKALQPHLGSVSLIPEIGEQLSNRAVKPCHKRRGYKALHFMI